MHLRSLFFGILIGAAVTAGAFLFFGEEIRDDVADVTERAGARVEKVGETIEEAAKEIR